MDGGEGWDRAEAEILYALAGKGIGGDDGVATELFADIVHRLA